VYDSGGYSGRLTVVGCGLHPGHMTLEAKSHIEDADKVLLVAPNPLSIQHIIQLNPDTENLGQFYQSSDNRAQTYREMARYIVEQVQSGLNICTVFYGHPGVFVTSTHIAMQKLRELGYPVTMLPGVSADACLYADLGLDPAFSGCQSYEATQFLLTERNWDVSAALLLWQIGLVGEHTLTQQRPGEKGLQAITRLLSEQYPANHRICLYEAATIPGYTPRIEWLRLDELTGAQVFPHTTLYVPALRSVELVTERLDWLGLTIEDTRAWQDESRIE